MSWKRHQDWGYDHQILGEKLQKWVESSCWVKTGYTKAFARCIRRCRRVRLAFRAPIWSSGCCGRQLLFHTWSIRWSSPRIPWFVIQVVIFGWNLEFETNPFCFMCGERVSGCVLGGLTSMTSKAYTKKTWTPAISGQAEKIRLIYKSSAFLTSCRDVFPWKHLVKNNNCRAWDAGL